MAYVTYNTEKFEIYGVIYRISLVVLVQFVGFFFLRLYVGNELDIKQNKNEITNLELKAIACYLSEKNKSNNVGSIIESLVREERNFVLKGGDKSVSHESKHEFNDLSGMLKVAIDKIPVGKS